MEAFLKFLNQNWIGVLIGVIGIILAFVFYIKSQIHPSLSYQSKSFTIIEKYKQLIPKNVEILFDGKPVTKLAKAYVILWNSGKTVIYGSNIVVDDPLRLEFDVQTQILQARVVKSNRITNKFTVNTRNNSSYHYIVDLNFDYFEPGDGAVIEILYTGEDSPPNIKGTIKGLPEGVKNIGEFNPKKEPKKFLMIKGIIMIIFVMTLIIGRIIINFLKPPMPIEKFNIIAIYVTIVFFMLLFAVSGIQSWYERKKFPKSLAIREVDFFWESYLPKK